MFSDVRSLQSARIPDGTHIHTHEQDRDGSPPPVGYRKPGGFAADPSSFTPRPPPPGADPQYVERITYSRCEL
jgi:hypothetical protein